MVQTMESPHLGLYDEAFGSQPADWLAASPYQQMHGETMPILVVCSSRRKDSCPQAHGFVREAESFGSRARVVEEDLSHGEINAQLGLPSAYTDAVKQFMRALSPDVAERLSQATAPEAPLSGNIDH